MLKIESGVFIMITQSSMSQSVDDATSKMFWTQYSRNCFVKKWCVSIPAHKELLQLNKKTGYVRAAAHQLRQDKHQDMKQRRSLASLVI
jgi:hypothetical protein